MATTDYYETLGIARGASEAEIRTAFRTLARKWHPDARPGDKEAEARFKAIAEAYGVLSDPEKRGLYDRFGSQWEAVAEGAAQAGAGAGPSTGSRSWAHTQRIRLEDLEDLKDLFGDGTVLEDLFAGFSAGPAGAGGGNRPRSGASLPRAGRDLVQPVQLTLEEAFHGTTRTLQVRDASGSRRVDVRIPPGAASGLRVRAAGQGEPGLRGAPAGDLYLEVTVAPHPDMRREGDDLHTRIAVPVWTLLLGGEVDVKGLSGHVTLKVPPETDDGSRLRLRGQGMPRLKADGQRGDLLVEVHAQLPHNLSPTERELVARLARRGAEAPGPASAFRSWAGRFFGARHGTHARAW